MVYCMLINKAIFILSLAFKLSMRALPLSLIFPMQHSMNMSSLRFGLGDFDVLFTLRCSMVFEFDVAAYFGPSGLIALACAWKTTLVLSNINSFTSWYHLHFSDRWEQDFMFIACSPCSRCRWHSTSSCKPHCPSWNRVKETQISCATWTSCLHLYIGTLCKALGKWNNREWLFAHMQIQP